MAQQNNSKSMLVICAWVAVAVVILSSLSLILMVQTMASKYDQFSKHINRDRYMQERGVSPLLGTREERVFKSIKNYSMRKNRMMWKNMTGPVKTIENPIIRREAMRLLFGPDSKSLRAQLDQVVVLSSLLPPLKNISRISTPSPEAFRDYIAPTGQPVIFMDMLDGQKLGDWTWDYIRARWGNTEYKNIRQGNFSTKTAKNGKHIINRVSVTLNDFIDVVTGKREPGPSEEGLYIAKKRLIPLRELENEFFYPPFYPGKHDKCFLEPSSWFGAPGTFTQGHIDSKDNFVYQIIGQKRWTIFPPRDYKRLYYTETKGSLEWSKALNNFEAKIDVTKFPLAAETSPVTFIMNPGEVLYLPRGWTHTVANLSPNLMMNTWRYGPAAITQPWIKKNDAEIRKRCY